MKKVISILLIVIFMLILTACSNVGGVNEENGGDYSAVLQQNGISEEQFAAMSEEEKQVLLDELGAKAEAQQQDKPGEKPKAATLEDVANGGDYVVTAGDGRMQNYFELHFKDGKLVKIVTSFQKSDEEEAEVDVVSGDAIAEYEMYFIDYTQSPSAVVEDLKEKGFTHIYIN